MSWKVEFYSSLDMPLSESLSPSTALYLNIANQESLLEDKKELVHASNLKKHPSVERNHKHTRSYYSSNSESNIESTRSDRTSSSSSTSVEEDTSITQLSGCRKNSSATQNLTLSIDPLFNENPVISNNNKSITSITKNSVSTESFKIDVTNEMHYLNIKSTPSDIVREDQTAISTIPQNKLFHKSEIDTIVPKNLLNDNDSVDQSSSTEVLNTEFHRGFLVEQDDDNNSSTSEFIINNNDMKTPKFTQHDKSNNNNYNNSNNNYNSGNHNNNNNNNDNKINGAYDQNKGNRIEKSSGNKGNGNQVDRERNPSEDDLNEKSDDNNDDNNNFSNKDDDKKEDEDDNDRKSQNVAHEKSNDNSNDNDNGNDEAITEESVLDRRSLVENESYFQDLHDENILLNKMVSRNSRVRRNTLDSTATQSFPFHASKHAQIMPIENPALNDGKNIKFASNMSMNSLPIHDRAHVRKVMSSSHASLPSLNNNDGSLKRSESATAEIRKMRETMLHKRELKRHKKTFLQDDDRVLIGNKVSEGHVNFIIAYNMLSGIRVSVSRCSGVMKPLSPIDFKFNKKLAFDFHGNELTPSSQYAFKFKDYAPEVFRELRSLFGLDPADYLVSLTSKYVLSELHSPGKSGSFFYYSRDYKYIIKTIHHSEHRHLRKNLKEYYDHVKKYPNTLISQFYGLHRVKMPISFQSKIQHRRIYFLVMNNLFPPHLQMHTTYDLKGSTWGRFTETNEQLKKLDPTYRPVLKDKNWLQNKTHINFGPEKKAKFLEQLKKDVALLSKLNIMDYSLLIGIHDLRKSGQTEGATIANGDATATAPANSVTQTNTDIVRTNTAINRLHRTSTHYFKSYEGGILGSDEDNNDIEIIYYVGIIDCLTNYSIIKKLETFWRSLNHDLKVVSAVPPKEYSNRFYKFIENSVTATPQTSYKDNPNAKPYED